VINKFENKLATKYVVSIICAPHARKKALCEAVAAFDSAVWPNKGDDFKVSQITNTTQQSFSQSQGAKKAAAGSTFEIFQTMRSIFQ